MLFRSILLMILVVAPDQLNYWVNPGLSGLAGNRVQ